MAITYAFLSGNKRKCAEYEAQLAKYSRSLKVLPFADDETTRLADIRCYLETADEKDRFVLRETSDLFVADDWDRGVATVSSKNMQDERVYHVSNLAVYTLDGTGDIQEKSYRAEVEGHIDLSQRTKSGKAQEAESAATQWWDDIFVTGRSQASYHEESTLWGKCSARQEAIGMFICDHLMFKRLRDMNFNPHKPKQAVDFDDHLSAVSVLRNNVFIGMAQLDRCPWGLGNLLRNITNAGVFMRSADSNRSGNYFLPPLSGVPRYKKPDPFWETTYQFHDFCHQAVPDPLFSGLTDDEHRYVFTAARLMSEGLTIILADMLFVEAMKDNGFKYDYSTRKINPLFASLNLPAGDKRAQLKALLRANVQFANLGDEAPYRAMLKPGCEKELEAYTDTYKHFFVPDFIWSVANYDDMAARSDTFNVWTKFVGRDLFTRARLPLLSDLVATLKASGADLSSYESCVGPVFEHLFEQVLAPQLEPVTAVLDERAQSNAFLRYMIGQTFLYSTYRHVKGMKARGLRMIEELEQIDLFTQRRIDRIRAMYGEDLLALQKSGIITADDLKLYTEIFPLLSPRFLSYDFGKPLHDSVPAAIAATFGQRAR